MKDKVKIRIALAVDAKGNWSASGWMGATDKMMVDTTLDVVEDGEHRYFLECEVPLPILETIQVNPVRSTHGRDEG